MELFNVLKKLSYLGSYLKQNQVKENGVLVPFKKDISPLVLTTFLRSKLLLSSYFAQENNDLQQSQQNHRWVQW